MKDKLTKGSLIAAIVTAIASSLCCVAPLILLTLGISGAWVSTLTHLEFIRPIGISLTIFFLGLAFWKLYINPKSCSANTLCVQPKVLRCYRIIFWIITVFLVVLMTFPWYAGLFGKLCN